MKAFNQALSRFANYAPLVIRVIIGALFLLHGLDKLNVGLGNIEAFFASEGVPIPALTAPFVAFAEILLGAALIVGFATRISAAVLAAIIVGALIWVKNDAILGRAELDLAYLAALLAIIVTGPGEPSVDHTLGLENSTEGLATTANAT